MCLFQLLWMILTGFIVGLIARAILPGADDMGFFATTVVGILGSFVGGFIGNMFSKKPPSEKKPTRAGFFLSLLGAMLLIILWRYMVV